MIYRDRFKEKEGLDEYVNILCPMIDIIMPGIFPASIDVDSLPDSSLELQKILFGQPFVFLQLGPFQASQALCKKWTYSDHLVPYYVNHDYIVGNQSALDYVNGLFILIEDAKKNEDDTVIELERDNGCKIYLFPEKERCLKVIDKSIADDTSYANEVSFLNQTY